LLRGHQLAVPPRVEVERVLQPPVLHLERHVLLAQLLIVGEQALERTLLTLVELQVLRQSHLKIGVAGVVRQRRRLRVVLGRVHA
jgi:hypothetical protein